MRRTLIAATLMTLVTTGVQAEQRTIYGSDGKVASRSVTDSNGAVTHYSADGRVVGREATTTRSGTTIYDCSRLEGWQHPSTVLTPMTALLTQGKGI